MNHQTNPGKRPDVAERDLSDGFEAVMGAIGRLTSQEIAGLRLRADAAELGHDAYALGLTLLDHGEHDQAKHWLRTAAQYGVQGARRVLEELAAHSIADVPGRMDESPLTKATSTVATGRLGQAGTAAASSKDTMLRKSVGGVVLPASREGLARGVPSSAPGTIFVLALTGGITLGPADGRQVLFGRDRNQVHICLGEDDRYVSRHQGTLSHSDGQWRVRNTGELPIRIGHRLLFRDEDPVPLGTGYTQMFVRTPRDRQHLLEAFVSGSDSERPTPRHSDATRSPDRWQLSHRERLVLVAFGRRYLEHELYPQPLSWRETAATLAELEPEEGWTAKKVEHVVAVVRGRLSRAGVPGLTREEVGEPVGNTLNHNLIEELLTTTTIVPMDLALLNAA